MKLGLGKSNDENKDIRNIIREELQLLIPDMVKEITKEIFKSMPPEVVKYKNSLESARVHNQETKKDFSKEIEGHKERMKQHEQKYPDTPTMDRISNKGISLAQQMGDRQTQIERIQRRQRRSN